MSLKDLMQRAALWRGGDASPRAAIIPSGFPPLDAALGGGWPAVGLTEILLPREGIGELRLVLPALARLSRGERWLAFIAPPHILYAPALAQAGVELSRIMLVAPRAGRDGLWAVEQALRAGTCAAVFAWPAAATPTQLRRLQLAAEAGRCWGVMFPPARQARGASPAVLRLRLAPAGPAGLSVEIVKRRGGWPAAPVMLALDTPEMNHVVGGRAPAGAGVGGVRTRHDAAPAGGQ